MGKGADGIGLVAPLMWREDKIQALLEGISLDNGAPARRADPESVKLDAITMTELARHCTALDCWIAIEGEVSFCPLAFGCPFRCHCY